MVLALLATTTLATAADQSLKPYPCHLSPEDAVGLSQDFTTDVHALQNYKGTIARLLKAEKFEDLDCLADRARSNKERFPGGTWKIHEIYRALYKPVQYPQHATEEDYRLLLQRLKNWQTARPNSITARIALGWAYIAYAGYARGDGYANTVSQNGWKLHDERMAEAERILADALTLPTKCPEWYMAMENVAEARGWSETQKNALFGEADKFEPDYFYSARARAYYLQPKWSGQPGDTERFVNDLADRIGGEQGDILYFEVASSPDLICGCDDEPHFSWERILRGYEASEKRYGVSLAGLNRMAYLAENYGDRDPVFADKAFGRIGDQWDEETWHQKKEDFDAAKQWAAQTAPDVMKVRNEEAAAKTNTSTPEGARYQVAFEKSFRELLQDCVRSTGNDAGAQWQKGKFETMMYVGAKGTADDGWINAMGPAVACAYRKIKSARQEQLPIFPAPPQANYWVRLDLDWADFTSVAAK